MKFLLIVWLVAGPSTEGSGLTYEECEKLRPRFAQQTACIPELSFEGR